MKSMSIVVLGILIFFTSCRKEHSKPKPTVKGDISTSVSFANYPASGQWATLVFEDNWPRLGDYDMNDLVVSYRYTFGKDKSGNLISLNADFTVLASGASFYNGLGVDLPIDAALVKNVSGQQLTAGYIKLNSNGTEAGQTDAVIVVFDNHENLLHYYDHSYFINVYPSKYRTTGDTAHIQITFTKPIDKSYLTKAPFNPFLISNMHREQEIHLPGGKPTDKANMSLFNTADDNSGGGTSYVAKNKNPWAINFTDGPFEYPVETAAIATAYLHYGDWVASDGKKYKDWHTNKQPGYRSDDKIFH